MHSVHKYLKENGPKFYSYLWLCTLQHWFGHILLFFVSKFSYQQTKGSALQAIPDKFTLLDSGVRRFKIWVD